MGTGRRILAATAVGAGAAGAAGAGLALQRTALRRLELRPDPYAGEPFGSLRGRPVPVRAADGTRLYAEIDDPERTDLAIVFSHGWTLTQDSWHFQRKALRGLGRLVFWDQRGHGRSDAGDRLANDVPLLGHDLAAVIEQTVPAETPVILVGHSMGGMTIMRYADLYPEEIGRRVHAACLLCTSSGGLHEVTLGLPAAIARLNRVLLPRTLRAAGAGAGLIERVRHLGRDGLRLVEDQIAFGPDASPTAVAFAEEMAAETRMEALFDFFRSMITHQTISDCSRLSAADVMVIGARRDALTPVSHSHRIAECLPDAQLEIIQESGHMAMLERPAEITHHLTDLIERTRKNLGG